jgi:RND family efflux transporter MFP subunit
MTERDLTKLKIERGAGGKIRAPGGSRIRSILAGVLVVALLAAAGYGYLSQRAQEVDVTTVVTAYPYQGLSVLNATGYVVPQRKAAVATKATGRVEWLGVTEGSQVREGEVLARLESRDVTAARDQAAASVRVAEANLLQGRAELTDAEAAHQRAADLYRRSFVSQATLDASEARLQKAKAGIAGLEAAITVAKANLRANDIAVDQTLIRAPFDGVVLTKSANVGDVVTPFSSALDTKGAVVTMADMATLEVEADVAESSLSKVRVGQPCEVQLDALPDTRFRGEVSRMVPTVDRSRATVMVKIRFLDLDPRILPDMTAKVSFLSREVPAEMRKPVTAVLPAAIQERDGRKIVYRVSEGSVDEIAVETGASIGDLVEVTRGLKPGDKVVLAPGRGLRDKARVTVK